MNQTVHGGSIEVFLFLCVSGLKVCFRGRTR